MSRDVQNVNDAAVGQLASKLQGIVPTHAHNYHGAPEREEEGRRVVEVRPKQICWAFPMDEIVFQDWMVNLIHMRPMPWDEILTIKSTYLPDARNKLHEQFVEQANSEWLFMLDSDVCPPPDTVSRLLRHHKTNPKIMMVGGWYRKKGSPYAPVVYRNTSVVDGVYQYQPYTEDDVKKSGLEVVDAAGAGIWLMHRSVAEAIGPRPYNMNEGGEDLLLCRKVQQAGFSCYIDWSINAFHVGVGKA